MDDDLELAGIPRPADGEVEEEDAEEECLLIYPENWQAVQVFMALSNCWRIDPWRSKYLGIIRDDIDSTMRLMGIKRKRRGELFEDLRVMENAALEALNARDS